MTKRLWFGIIFACAWMGLFQPVRGMEIHVDNTNGVDGNDGLAPDSETTLTGPVQTLRRAMQLARPGDTIVLKANSRPFYEPLQMVGGRHSGFESIPLTIQGNGATISGLRPVPTEGWRQTTDGLWRLSLSRKGYYRFFRDNELIPEFLPTASDATANHLPLDHYISRQGAVFFKFDAANAPYTQPWTYAAEDTGISLVDVRNVRITNLHVVGFRVDGVNVDGNCRNVTLDNVTIEHNGRAGLSTNGTSQVVVENSRIAPNGRHSVLITEHGRVNLTACDLGGVEPTVE